MRAVGRLLRIKGYLKYPLLSSLEIGEKNRRYVWGLWLKQSFWGSLQLTRLGAFHARGNIFMVRENQWKYRVTIEQLESCGVQPICMCGLGQNFLNQAESAQT